MVTVINWCYTNEGFTYRVLNHCCRTQDTSKISTLGPFSLALSIIIGLAAQYRTDLNPWDFAKCLFFRGSGLTEADIQDYRNLSKTLGNMRLFGYTSTSRTRSVAESFAYSNEHSKTNRVCFHIHWENATQHYFMNAGAFADEEEILLTDGAAFDVLSVLDHEYQRYEIQKEGSEHNGAKCVIVDNQLY